MWVVLSAESKIVLGRFTNEDLIQRLYEGKISFQDYVWKEGYSQWKIISHVKELDSSKQESSFTTTAHIYKTDTSQMDTTELFSSIQLLDQRTDFSYISDEVGTKDLVAMRSRKI